MKTMHLTITFCLLLFVTPVSMSQCDCMHQEPMQQNENETHAWLSENDILLLEQQAALNAWTFTVGANTATKRPFHELCGLVEPDDWWLNASFDPCLPKKNLPSSFDWRQLGGCTPVRNQGGCGSCWAFGTLAALECNILIRDKKEVDLSEQWLVSCNTHGWGCSGGWWAHDYLHWKVDACNGVGTVLEEDFPYQAEDVPCNGPYGRPYRIDSWRYVGFYPGISPTDSIKQAIMTYGPVSVACAVTPAFGAYTGGVFNEDDPQAQINHAVALVGWDDTQGESGVWFLRNSWGPEWGEEGYMRIEYGVCKVGYSACYVDYPAKTNIDIMSGMLGAGIAIQNNGNTTTTGISWEVIMKGGIAGHINLFMQSTISSLEPGETSRIRIPRVGFGPVSIFVNVIPENAGRQAKQVQGFLCGLLCIVFQNQ